MVCGRLAGSLHMYSVRPSRQADPGKYAELRRHRFAGRLYKASMY